MKKLILGALIALMPFLSKAQFAPDPAWDPVNNLFYAAWHGYQTGANELYAVEDDFYFNIYTQTFLVSALANGNVAGVPMDIVSTDATGKFYVTKVDSIKLDYSHLLNPPVVVPSTFNSLSNIDRSLNTAYMISSTNYSKISVSSKITCVLSLITGQSGSIILEKSVNGTTGWAYVGEIDGSNTGALSIGINTSQITGGALETILAPGYYWRLRTTGTGTFAFNGGEETIY